MQSEESKLSLAQGALLQCQFVASNLLLIDESLLLLSQKRSTLEERAIAKYFHKLCSVYADIVNSMHCHMSNEQEFDASIQSTLERLRTVNENVASCVAELVKIQKYNASYLEQYFEYDYCARLLDNQELLTELNEINQKLEDALHSTC